MVFLDKYIFITENHNGFKYSERWLKKNHPWVLEDIDSYVQKNGLDSLPFKQKLYCTITNGEPKKCYCGNVTRFISINGGYGNYCSNKCTTNSKEFNIKRKKTNIDKYGSEFYTQTKEYIEKVKKTNLEKYGNEYSVQSELVKDKIKKTNLEKYGNEYSVQSELVKDKIKKTKKNKYGDEYYNNSLKIKDSLKKKYDNPEDLKDFLNKQKETNLKKWGVEYASKNEEVKKNNLIKTIESVNTKYGTDNVFSLEEIKDKIKNTNLNKWGVEYYSQSEDYKEKIKKNNLEILLKEIPKKYHLINSNKFLIELSCDKSHNFEINRQLFFVRKKMGHEICTICNPINKQYSSSEKEIYDYVKTLVEDVIENDRSVLNKKELDILIPKHDLAIEYNGLYWHSELYCDKNYHLNKTKECESKGLNLIHIFEDEWLYKKDIVKSIIKNRLGLIDKKIYARNCEIKEISTKESKDFLNKNHIQGYVNSQIKLGLFHKDELVSVMTFGSLRKALGSKHKEGHWELIRFCNKLNYSIIGGSSKLFKFFNEKFKPNEITSYSDNRWFSGDMYMKLGFEFNSETKPNYYYIVNNIRENRFKYRKDQLVKLGHDPNKSEWEIMLNQGLYRIWDCGNKKWVFKL
jgi:hypothetical protein